MKRIFKDIAFGVLFLAAVTGLYYAVQHFSEAAKKPKTQVEESPPKTILYPVPDSGSNAEKTQTPGSTDPTSSLASALTDLLGKESFESWVMPGDLVRNFVVTIDNMTGPRLPVQYFPVKKPEGEFAVKDSGTDVEVSPKNFERFSKIIGIASSIDLNQWVKIYIKFYPLVQKAYAELGQNKYFNDRFVEVIDDLLNAPLPKEPIKLLRVSVVYKFENPELEDLDIGKKLMLRMGPANEKKRRPFKKFKG